MINPHNIIIQKYLIYFNYGKKYIDNILRKYKINNQQKIIKLYFILFLSISPLSLMIMLVELLYSAYSAYNDRCYQKVQQDNVSIIRFNIKNNNNITNYNLQYNGKKFCLLSR